MINKIRLHWVDSLRGLFIMMMVAYHFAFDLDYFSLVSFDFTSGFWTVFSHLVELGFFGLVGFSLHLSFRRSDYFPFLKRQLKRAGLVLSAAMAITALTHFLFPGGTIAFGALHFIAFSIALGAFLTPYPLPLALSLIPIALLGAWFADLNVTYYWLMPFGLVPSAYASLDYFPLFPWLAVVFIGILIGRWMEGRKFLKNPEKLPRLPPLEFLGRHSLLIYVLHQPILFSMLWLFQRV